MSNKKIETFQTTLCCAEPEVGIPGMGSHFYEWGGDVQKYIENIWPELAQRALENFATELFVDISWATPIEQKLYFALWRRYIGYFFGYPNSTKLLVNKHLNEISSFLQQKGQKAIYQPGDVDFEIDLFLYLDCFLIEMERGGHIRYPFYIGVECDGHDYHERTKQQAQKDKSKDRILRVKGLDIIRFTGSEITRNPDECVKEIDDILDSHLFRVKGILDLSE
jgi:hypothetical protein